jgi:alkanesulfonate monooxygenase SsuD/methylene tetrahydromethanopterin reductase-like flavin-dependent oxidoreductase (luciferase family)
MQLGLFSLLTHRDNPRGIPGVIDDACSMVETAEAAGFDVAWFAEHHFTNYSLSVSPLMMASHLAARTKRIKVGPCVVVLPLHNPLRAAQEIALLDQQSGGRAMLGLGSGYQAYEFDRFGTPIAEKTEVFLDYWEVMRQALVDGHVRFEGRHITVPETVVAIRPVQAPMPPLFLTSLHPAVLAKLAPDGAVPFVSSGSKGTTAARVVSRDATLKSWTACGFDPATMPVALMSGIHITDSPAEALEAAERARYYTRMVHALRASILDLDGATLRPVAPPDEPTLEEFRDNFVIGDAHHVAERVIQDIRLLDPIHYNCFFQFGDMPVARARRSLERFAAEVIPLVERAVGPLDRIGLRPPVTRDASAAA